MAGHEYDVIVIGAGVIGLATAYKLARGGQKVLLLEQFSLPHSWGSSHGQSRIIRKAYAQEYYASMMPEAYKMWQELEQEAGLVLFKCCGLLLVGPRSCPAVESTTKSLKYLGCEYELLDGRDVCRRYPGLKFPDDISAIYEPGAGILKPDLILGAYQRLFVAHGGELKDSCPVLGIRPGNVVHVTTKSATFQARSVVITAGPWTNRLIKPLGLNPPLQPKIVTVAYLKEKVPGTYDMDNGFPSVVFYLEDNANLSRKQAIVPGTLPVSEHPGYMKMALHTGIDIIDPDRRDEVNGETWNQEFMQKIARDHYPGLEDKLSIVEKCFYTMTPDEDFILDTHPQWKNIVIGAGFSGHGFKLAPVVGKLLSEMATGKNPSYNLLPFKMDRFFKNPDLAKL